MCLSKMYLPIRSFKIKNMSKSEFWKLYLYAFRGNNTREHFDKLKDKCNITCGGVTRWYM